MGRGLWGWIAQDAAESAGLVLDHACKGTTTVIPRAGHDAQQFAIAVFGAGDLLFGDLCKQIPQSALSWSIRLPPRGRTEGWQCDKKSNPAVG